MNMLLFLALGANALAFIAMKNNIKRYERAADKLESEIRRQRIVSKSLEDSYAQWTSVVNEHEKPSKDPSS